VLSTDRHSLRDEQRASCSISTHAAADSALEQYIRSTV
jgi:hypothetical protein